MYGHPPSRLTHTINKSKSRAKSGKYGEVLLNPHFLTFMRTLTKIIPFYRISPLHFNPI